MPAQRVRVKGRREPNYRRTTADYRRFSRKAKRRHELRHSCRQAFDNRVFCDPNYGTTIADQWRITFSDFDRMLP